MIKNLILTLTIITIGVASAVAQGTFKPRNADEEHAWRLYNQYKTSKQKEAQLKAGIDQTKGDIKTMGVGSVPIYIDPQDVAQLTKLREQLKTEQERQKNLEAAWDKKFFGRYGDLSDSSGTIYDPKTKKTMDKIQFRLIYFPFYVNDGTYVGTVVGAPGSVTITIAGTAVKGTMSGVYKYTFGGESYSDKFTGYINGSLANQTSISATLSGNVGGAEFTGRLQGTISKGIISGTWTTRALTTASGTFTAKKR